MLDEGCILHITATLEGVYIISFSPNGIIKGEEFLKYCRKNSKASEYKYMLPSCLEASNAMHPLEYLDRINAKIPDSQKIFHIEFLTWDQLHRQQSFKFYFPASADPNPNLRCKPRI